MNSRHASRHHLWRLLGMLAIVVTIIAGRSVAEAAESATGTERIVALEFDHASGTLLKATAKTLSQSSDQGNTWTNIALPPSAAKSNLASVATAAGNKDVLYIAAPGVGVLRSKDGGRNWSATNKGLPNRSVVALSTHAEQPDTVYAYVTDKGIFRSQDGGVQWRLMDKGPRANIAQFVHSNMPGSMETGWLFAATSEGVRRSMDCFCGWHKAGELAGKVNAVAYDPDEPKRVYAATAKGMFVTEDGGEQWASMKSPESAVITLTAAPSGVLFAGGNGNLFRSRDRGQTWEKVNAA
jgi:photosystem II stability/assembly factor-like uncharacterized protein